MNLAKFLRTTIFYRTPLAAASEVILYNLKKKPQQNRVSNSELRNFNFNLFFYLKVRKILYILREVNSSSYFHFYFAYWLSFKLRILNKLIFLYCWRRPYGYV